LILDQILMAFLKRLVKRKWIQIKKTVRRFLINQYGMDAKIIKNGNEKILVKDVILIGTALFKFQPKGLVLNFYGHPSWAATDLKIRYFLRYLLVKLRLSRVSKIKTVNFLYHPFKGNYFHFVVQQILYFAAFERLNLSAPIFTGLNKSGLKPWQKRYLELLEIDTFQFLEVSTNYRIQELVVLPEMPALRYNKQLLNSFRNRILKSLACSQDFRKSDFSKRVLISRADATNRQIKNEHELLNFLEPFGFEKIVLSQLNVDQQVALFHKAEVIIAPHGAGNTNLLYCQPWVHFIELRLNQSGQADDYYEKMTEILELKYTPLFCKKVDDQGNMTSDASLILNELRKNDLIKPIVR